jgi:NAD-dependent deacetylase
LAETATKSTVALGIATVFDAKLVENCRKARRWVVFTGAGVSAESGIPTFRDKLTGLWERIDHTELSTWYSFERNPALVWGWYEWRRAQILKAHPNPAHESIAALASQFPDLTLVTQNIDDLHERGGSQSVLHLHGEILKPRCEKCEEPYQFPPGIPEVPDGGCLIEPPRCPHCLWRIRPGVVCFGEPLPKQEWSIAKEAAERCEVFLCVGTSAIVQPAGSLGTRAMHAGAVTIQINPNPTESDDEMDYAIRQPAGVALPELVRAICES